MVGERKAGLFDNGAETFEDGDRGVECGSYAGFDAFDEVFTRNTDAHPIDVAIKVFGEI